MSGVEQMSIILQHDIDEQYQYEPGEIIRGYIEVKVSKQLGVRAINIKVYGEGNVSWKDGHNEAVYQAQEVYLDAENIVVDTTNHEPLNLTKGTHEFPFDYVLPEHIPSSYIGKYGNVTYTMKATLAGLQPSTTAISSEPFLVLRRSPIPAHAQKPVTLEAEKRMWASCSFGKLYMKVSLDKCGGVPGEDIFLQAEIKNRSKRTVTAMQASLVMTSQFRAQNHHTEFRQIVSKKRDEFDVSYNEGRRWNFVRLTLPPYIPETKLEHCDIIELDYIFQFRVELTGGSEVRLEAPFWIGANPQGLEVPEDERAGLRISRQWTVRAKGMVDLGEEISPFNHDEYDHGWGVEIVPELRGESTTVNNPLFKQAPSNGVKVIPEEFIESTKL